MKHTWFSHTMKAVPRTSITSARVRLHTLLIKMSPCTTSLLFIPDYPTKKCNSRVRPNFFLSCIHLDLCNVLRTNTNASSRCTANKFCQITTHLSTSCSFLPRLPSRAKSIVLHAFTNTICLLLWLIPWRWNEKIYYQAFNVIISSAYSAYRTAYGCPIPIRGKLLSF